MEHTLEAYLKRQPTEILEMLLRKYDRPDPDKYAQQILEYVRLELLRRSGNRAP